MEGWEGQGNLELKGGQGGQAQSRALVRRETRLGSMTSRIFGDAFVEFNDLRFGIGVCVFCKYSID